MLPKRPPSAAVDATAVKRVTPPPMKMPPMDEMSMRFGGKGSGGMPGPPNRAGDEITKGYGMHPQDAAFPEVNAPKRWATGKRGQ